MQRREKWIGEVLLAMHRGRSLPTLPLFFHEKNSSSAINLNSFDLDHFFIVVCTVRPRKRLRSATRDDRVNQHAELYLAGDRAKKCVQGCADRATSEKHVIHQNDVSVFN